MVTTNLHPNSINNQITIKAWPVRNSWYVWKDFMIKINGEKHDEKSNKEHALISFTNHQIHIKYLFKVQLRSDYVIWAIYMKLKLTPTYEFTEGRFTSCWRTSTLQSTAQQSCCKVKRIKRMNNLAQPRDLECWKDMYQLYCKPS
jgi:hypothetical protein